MKKRLLSEFEKNALKIFSGAAIAQLIPWLASPVLTRLYNPEQFGLLTVLLSILTIGNTINTAKYEVAIYLPGNDGKAWTVVGLNVILAVVLSIGMLIVFVVFGDWLKNLLNASELGIWFYLAPVIILFMGIYKVLYSWLNRIKHFTHLALSRIFRSVGLTGVQLALGFTGFKSAGLLIGQGIGELGAAIYVLFASRRNLGDPGELTKIKMRNVAREYSGFPKFSLPGDFINSITNQVPVFLFSGYFGTAVVGQYGLTFRILSAPVSLLASAILDVFKQRASEDYAQTGSCREIFMTTLKRLTLFSLPVFLVIGLFGPFLFVTIFGKEWLEAGHYARILSILFFVRFIASPLSYVLYIAQKQKIDLFWQIGLCIVTLTSLAIGVSLRDVRLTLWLFALSYSAMYVIYLWLSYKYSVRKD